MKTERGFTLLEVMVAFTLMALSAAVLLQAFGGGVHLLGNATAQSRAASLARSQLARVGREWPLEEGEHQGRWRRYRWQVSVTPYQPDEPLPEHPTLRLLRVSVTVTWEEGGRRRQYQVTTLRLAPLS